MKLYGFKHKYAKEKCFAHDHWGKMIAYPTKEKAQEAIETYDSLTHKSNLKDELIITEIKRNIKNTGYLGDLNWSYWPSACE